MYFYIFLVNSEYWKYVEGIDGVFVCMYVRMYVCACYVCMDV